MARYRTPGLEKYAALNKPLVRKEIMLTCPRCGHVIFARDTITAQYNMSKHFKKHWGA